MNDQQKLKLDRLLEDYKDTIVKAYSWKNYPMIRYLKMTDAQHAAKQAIFDYFEKENNEN